MTPPRLYRISGLTLESDMSFPELPAEGVPGKERVTLVRLRKPPARKKVGAWIRSWVLPDGRLWARFARTARGHLVRFPGLADFELDTTSGTIRAFGAPGVPRLTLRHLALDQALPLLLSTRSPLVLHASSVAVNGGALAFAGRSGMGKSTLAACFARGGFPLLGDDFLRLEIRNGRYWGIPSYPGIRLWGDSAREFTTPASRVTGVAHYTGKKRLRGSGRPDEAPFQEKPIPLKALFLLEAPPGEVPVSVKLTRGGSREDFVALTRCVFLLETDSRQRTERLFHDVGEVASRHALFRLSFPRDLGRLEEVKSAILEGIASRG